MKQHIQTISGKFVDFNGVERDFTIAAVSEELPVDECECDVTAFVTDSTLPLSAGADFSYDPEIPVRKKLSLGVSIQLPTDKANPTIGEKIAIGRAIKKPYSIMYSTTTGTINTTMVTALLKQEAEYFHPHNPVFKLKAYIEAEKKFLAKKENNTENTFFTTISNKLAD